jgi:hypothetical protein
MSYSVGPKDVSLDGTGRPTERAPTIICPGALIRARSERSLWLRSRGVSPNPPSWRGGHVSWCHPPAFNRRRRPSARRLHLVGWARRHPRSLTGSVSIRGLR